MKNLSHDNLSPDRDGTDRLLRGRMYTLQNHQNFKKNTMALKLSPSTKISNKNAAGESVNLSA
jgi:hypothetical protein